MPKTKPTLTKKPLAILLCIALVAGIVGWIVYHNHQIQARISSRVIPSSSDSSQKASSTKSASANKPSSNSNVSPTDPKVSQGATNNQQAGASASSATLTSGPSGTFVSNHKPNLSGQPAPSEEQSTCNTIPGATCTIIFTSNGKTKQLSTQTADASGVVIWNWDVNTAGFTQGSWQITATATLNGTSKSTTDSLQLEVGP